MKLETFKTELFEAEYDARSENAEELLNIISDIEYEIFQGKKEPQPLKWHQVKRIYKLAQACIKLVIILIPYIRVIIKWLK